MIRRIASWLWPREFPLAPQGAAWEKQLAALRERLSTTLPEDTLLCGMIGLIDANMRVELQPLTESGVSDAEIHRIRGRIGMLRDLRAELTDLWHEARDTERKK